MCTDYSLWFTCQNNTPNKCSEPKRTLNIYIMFTISHLHTSLTFSFPSIYPIFIACPIHLVRHQLTNIYLLYELLNDLPLRLLDVWPQPLTVNIYDWSTKNKKSSFIYLLLFHIFVRRSTNKIKSKTWRNKRKIETVT